MPPFRLSRSAAGVISLLALSCLAACGTTSTNTSSPNATASPKVNPVATLITTTFKQDDSNRDGNISQSELNAIYLNDFNAMDVNGDGSVDGSDFSHEAKDKSGRSTTFASSFGSLDSNSDGTLAYSEYVAAENKLFAPLVLDIQRNGYVTWAQIKVFYAMGSATTVKGGPTPPNAAAALAPGSGGPSGLPPVFGLLILSCVGFILRRQFAFVLRGRIAVGLGVALAATCMTTMNPIAVHASGLFDNSNSGNGQEVYFICGTFCGTSWSNVQDGQEVADPGDGGSWCLPEWAQYPGSTSNGYGYMDIGECLNGVGDHDAVSLNDNPAAQCNEANLSTGQVCILTDENNSSLIQSYGSFSPAL